MNNKQYCQGCIISGSQKGHDCYSEAKFKAGGKHYCGQHFSIATFNPERFETARKLRAKHQARIRARLSVVK